MPEPAPPSSGCALKLLGIALFIFGGLIYGAFGGSEGDNPLAFLAVPPMILGLFLYFRGKRKAAQARAAGPNSPLNDSKPDVLYLRSFRDDTATAGKILFSGLTTDEEQLADALRPFGDLIAIGQPGEALPVPGAARVYATDAEWKQVVLARMRVATLVVIRAGNSPGLLWEVGQALSTLHPAKLVIFVFALSKSDYENFAARVRATFRLNLPQITSPKLIRTVVDFRENPFNVLPGFICFRDDWSAEFLPLPSTIIRIGYNDYKKSFVQALRPVFDRNRVHWQAGRRFGR
jgi:hypothetical protein